jgi:hypothetical protein
MTVGRLRLALMGETMFPPWTPFFLPGEPPGSPAPLPRQRPTNGL